MPSASLAAMRAPWIVWGSELSPFTLKLLLLCRTAGLPHRFLPTEGRFGERDRNLDDQIETVAAKTGVRSNTNGDEQVARWAIAMGHLTLAAEANRLTIVNAGGDLDADRFGLLPAPMDSQVDFAAGDRRP